MANVSATITFKFLAKSEDQHPTNDSSWGLCKRTLFALSTCRLPHLVGGNVRGGTREKRTPGEGGASRSPGPPPHRPPSPRPAGGFPGLNEPAGELYRGRGCQLPRLGRGLGKKRRKASEKVWGRDTHSRRPPNGVNTRGGAAGRGSGGEPRDTRYSRGWGGCQKVNTHAQKEEKKVKRTESEWKMDEVGGD